MTDATRCFDCFEEFAVNAQLFAVLKKMRDILPPPEAIEPASFFYHAQFDPVMVCKDCAGWYGEEAVKVLVAV
jgi:hypothetical protein